MKYILNKFHCLPAARKLGVLDTVTFKIYYNK